MSGTEEPRTITVHVPRGAGICRICLTQNGGSAHSLVRLGARDDDTDHLRIQLHRTLGTSGIGWAVLEQRVREAIALNVDGNHDLDAHNDWEALQVEEAVDALRESMQALAQQSREVDELEAREPGWSIPTTTQPSEEA